MTFERTFRLVSYAAVLCGFFALWLSGTFGLFSTGLFLTAVVTGWLFEDSRWQISEKLGTTLIVMALPFYYLAWRYQLIELYGAETAVAGILARMILSLTAVKLMQQKSDRDWIFLYLMSFFQVLLAAGLSISALYLLTFIIYLLLMVAAVIAFEVRATGRSVGTKFASPRNSSPASLPVRRLPATAFVLLIFTALFAAPLFFMLPRVGGAGFGGLQGGSSTRSGFSDVVRLGNIGTIQQTDEIVMRVKLEGPIKHGGLYFRGVALDTFDNRSWSKSKGAVKEPFVKGDRDIIQVDAIGDRDSLLAQTVYLEPMDTSIIFAVPRVVGIEGSFPIVEKDYYGGLSYRRSYERINYTALSDQRSPDPKILREDADRYPTEMKSYLQLPDQHDRRIFELAYSITSKEGNRYDRARAVERYLQNSFGYTLDQKAGGDEPVADFLFNVKEGHCEYFASAMAIMLRTQGIATRVVNGFHGGDYNDASDMTVVRQRNAHSWVEVYFPKEDVWIQFDPTPASNDRGFAGGGIAGRFKKYMEAAEAFWIQNFVAYDNQGQRSLLHSIKNGVVDSQQDVAEYFGHAKALLEEWWADVKGVNGSQASWSAVGWAAIYVVSGAFILSLLGWGLRKVVKSKVWKRLIGRVHGEPKRSAVDFYERMLAVLADKGLVRPTHQTPLEFALASGIPQTVAVTEVYQRVRYGEQELSQDEAREMDDLINRIAEV